jgi:hypothetical protein
LKHQHCNLRNQTNIFAGKGRNVRNDDNSRERTNGNYNNNHFRYEKMEWLN